MKFILIYKYNMSKVNLSLIAVAVLVVCGIVVFIICNNDNDGFRIRRGVGRPGSALPRRRWRGRYPRGRRGGRYYGLPPGRRYHGGGYWLGWPRMYGNVYPLYGGYNYSSKVCVDREKDEDTNVCKYYETNYGRSPDDEDKVRCCRNIPSSYW